MATAANSITGGTQTFNNTSTLNASVANAISGGTQILTQDSSVQIGANNALTTNTHLIFSNQFGDIGGTVALNGFSTVVGKIQSEAQGSGSIINNSDTDATLTVDGAQLGNSTFSGIIADGSGSGTLALIKAGTSTLTLAGNNTYTGATTVREGSLAVNGSVGSPVTVQNGAMLMGNGSVGTTTLEAGAIIAPGNSIGTLTVNGDLTFNPGSTYMVEADPNSNNSDQIVVQGTAHLSGGSVVHVGPEGGFSSARQYTILSANAVDGTFNEVSSNYAFLDPTLGYSPTTVTLQLERKQVPVDPEGPTRPIAFADLATTFNQRSAANGLDSLPASSALHEYVLTLPTGAAPAVFNNLSGEIHASTTSALLTNTAAARNLPLAHLRANLNAGMRHGAPTAQAGNTTSASALPISAAQPAWAELIGSWQTLKSDGNAAQVRQRIGGLFVGSDHAVGAGWRLGGALGYTDNNIRVDDRASKADVSSYSATIYGGKSFEAGVGKLNFLAGAGYAWHDVDTKRYAQVAGSSQKLTADYGASTTQLFTELGYAMPLSERTTLEPFAGLAWNDVRTRGFSETGGSAALSGRSSSYTQTGTTLGVRSKTGFTLGNTEGHLRATLGWRHAFGTVIPQQTMAFDGGQTFTVAGAPIARNAALAELGAEIAISRSTTLSLNYSGQYGGGNRENAGSLSVRWAY